MLSVIGGVLALYLGWRLWWPLRLSRRVKVLLSLLTLALACHHRIVAGFAGTWASPEIPRWAIACLSVGFATVLMLTVIVLLLDIALLLARALRWQRGLQVLRAPALRPALAVLPLLLSVYGAGQALAVPKVKQVQIVLAGLPAAFDGYRVLQLSDLHASRLLTGRWLQQVVARANAQQPDLIVITGDLVDGSVQARRDDYPPLGRLHAPDGVIAINGNHEYYQQYAQWMQVFGSLGLHVLHNQHLQLQRGDAVLTVAGVTDQEAGRHGEPLPDLQAALAGARAGAPVILLEHRPQDARANARQGVALQLSGHTHGGHIIGLDQLVKRANNGFVSGRYDVDGMVLYVSNGAGLWPGFGMRLGVPSEITVFTLRRAP